MKKILYIAPHSFPIHSSEAIVNSKLAFALASSGYLVDVYSIKPHGYYPDSQIEDKLKKHPNISVHLVEGATYVSFRKGMLSQIKPLYLHLKTWFKTGYLYNGITIPYSILVEVESEIKRNSGKLPYDVIITRGYLTELVGISIVRKYGLKWVANWNDPYPHDRFPIPYGKGANCKLPYFVRKLLDNIQKYASVHTFPSSRLRDYMLTYFKEVRLKNTEVIPHMAHSLFLPEKTVKQKRKMRMIHAGNVAAPRNPDNFLRALSSVIGKDSNFQNKIEITFVGKFSLDFNEKIETYGLTKVIKILPAMNYFDVMNLVCEHDIALVIEAMCEEGIYLPTKVVDSIQSGIPLFCVSPKEGTQRDLIEKYSIGYIANNCLIEEIESQLIKAVSDFESGDFPIIDKNSLSYFFENSIVAQYDKILNAK